MIDLRMPVLFVFILLSPGCREPVASRSAGVNEKAQPPSGQQDLADRESLENIFTKESSLSYQGYTLTKLRKKISVEGTNTEVSYAALKRAERFVANFDGLYHPMGNATEFGLFPFLRGGNKQIVIEQGIPRNWTHWIVSLVPDFRVVFDSTKWAVDGELTPIDVNADGVFEITKTLTTFYDLHKLPTSESPLIDILFMYDGAKGEYVPASRDFQGFALKGIEDEKRSLQQKNQQEYLSGVIHIVLCYIYAGKRDEGWSFFDTEYKEANKDLIKSDVLSKLKNEPVYRFINDP